MDEFYALKFLDEDTVVQRLLNDLENAQYNKGQTAQQAHVFVETIRAKKTETSGFNALMQSYDLTSEEGLALMTLAEALLRIPDTNTANDLIQDKLSDGDWSHLFDNAHGFLGKFSGYGLSFSQKIIDSMIGKMGMPIIRKACVETMRMMGKTFVLGRDIEEAIEESQSGLTRGYSYNFDMLGEGARTSADAQYYFDAYAHAIRTVGQSTSTTQDIFKRPGISVKLSALYPRFEFAQREKCVPFLTTKLQELCIIAAEYNINLTIDAEECDRFTTSLSIIKNIIDHPVLKTWDGFGFAVQAYHKRASAVIDKAITWAKSIDQKISIRLVKGAYWDSEIKHAQVEAHEGYPVFTRKENTDLSYLACAHKLLQNRDVIAPMFGTHNAQTVASILDMAGDDQTGFTFQRLHGMGEQLHDQILSKDIPSCIYAPVGTHKYLLAYLVRRLLENGANSSFVNKIYDDKTSIDDLTQHPIDLVVANKEKHAHPQIPLPSHIYKNRTNSAGLDLFEDAPLQSLFEVIKNYEDTKIDAPCIIYGIDVSDGYNVPNENPSNHHDVIGQTTYATDDNITMAYDNLESGFTSWNASDVYVRATALEKIADLYEENTNELMVILIREAGKTIPDAIAEVREAVDFCRYYAVQARKDFALKELEGPIGETNTLQLEGRGIFACISPWNFPLAIFTGQIVAALVAGNAVMIKPAEQTPAIATYAVRLMLAAGIPDNVIALIQGDGLIGEKIIAHPSLAGVAFTGSTDVAKIIQRQLADKDGAIIPLIAETGGLNAMIVDSTALPEQVTDDVLYSAFGSAGQRCSALRILCVQDDVADEIIPMIKGAMDHLTVGDPSCLSTDIGPIIDEEAKRNLVNYRIQLEGTAQDTLETPHDERLEAYGTFFTPFMAEMNDIDLINTEAFGPILHIIRYKEDGLETLIEKINQKGFGLTFGLHSRIQSKHSKVSKLIKAGNIYINRGQTGAVVGVQPFGGQGLSGTGPKAGGPHYLHAFATEKSISDNITASGGNATLVNL